MAFRGNKLIGATVTWDPVPASTAPFPLVKLDGGTDSDWVTGGDTLMAATYIFGYARWQSLVEDEVVEAELAAASAVGGDWVLIQGKTEFGIVGLAPKGISVEHSDNGTDWTVHVAKTGMAAGSQPHVWTAVFDVSGAGDHAWWRVRLTANNDATMSLSNVAILDDVDIPRQLLPTASVTGVSEGAFYVDDAASGWETKNIGIDGVVSITDNDPIDATGTNTTWTVDVGVVKEINRIRLYGFYGSDYPRNRATGASCEYSDNGTDWTVLTALSGFTATPPTGRGISIFDFDTSAQNSHQHWRIVVTGILGVFELEMVQELDHALGADTTYSQATHTAGAWTDIPMSVGRDGDSDWREVAIGNQVNGFRQGVNNDLGWVGWNHGAGNDVTQTFDLLAAKDIGEMTLVGQARTDVGRPTELTLEHSDDGVAWTPFASHTGLTASNTMSWWLWREDIGGITARYWRVTQSTTPSNFEAAGRFVLFGVAAAPPDAPTNPAATADSQTQITVTWDDVADETGYRVERSPDGSGSWVDVSGNLAADTTSYQDTGLTCGTQYFYRVFAFNADGDSTPSSTVNATTDACTPSSGGNRMGGTGAIRRRGGQPR